MPPTSDGAEHCRRTGQRQSPPGTRSPEDLGHGERLPGVLLEFEGIDDLLVRGEHDGILGVAVGIGLSQHRQCSFTLPMEGQPTW